MDRRSKGKNNARRNSFSVRNTSSFTVLNILPKEKKESERKGKHIYNGTGIVPSVNFNSTRKTSDVASSRTVCSEIPHLPAAPGVRLSPSGLPVCQWRPYWDAAVEGVCPLHSEKVHQPPCLSMTPLLRCSGGRCLFAPFGESPSTRAWIRHPV